MPKSLAYSFIFIQPKVTQFLDLSEYYPASIVNCAFAQLYVILHDIMCGKVTPGRKPNKKF